MKKITSRPFWDYLLFLFFLVSLFLFGWSFFVPKINFISLSSYIILFIVYILSEKLSQRQINYSEKTFSYFIIYLLFCSIALYYFKINQNGTVELFTLSLILITLITTIIIQTIYFVRKEKLDGGIGIKIIIIGIIAIILIVFSIIPRLIILSNSCR